MNLHTLCFLTPTLLLPICTATAELTFTKVGAGDIGSDALHSQTVAWGDYDGDGWVDLFAGFNTFKTESEPSRLYHNNGDGTFTRLLDGGIADDMETNYPMGSAWADFENDGDLDLFVVQNANFQNSRFDRFYLNNGDGTFIRSGQDWVVSEKTIASSWGDYDKDGLLDLFVTVFQGGNSILYHHEPDGSMTENTFSLGGSANITFSVMWSDIDDDNDLDLCIAGGSTVYRNNGDGTFTPDTGFSADSGFAVATADYDNDGDLDLANLYFPGNNQLFQNDGTGGWTEVPGGPIASDVSTSCTSLLWGDFDNDGYLDLLIPNFSAAGRIENPNLLLHNDGDGTFTRVTEGPLVTDIGASFTGALADYDNDGDLDVALVDGQDQANQSVQLPAKPVALYRNDGANDNNWINLTLVGTVSNRSAIGAKVFVTANIDGGLMEQLREVRSGGDFSHSDLRVHFGLGDATAVDTLRIEWPSGFVQEMQEVGANQFLTIEEGWAGYPIVNQDMDVDTGDFLGWLNVSHGDWVWSYSMETWIYFPAASVDESGAWAYVPLSPLAPSQEFIFNSNFPACEHRHWIKKEFTPSPSKRAYHALAYDVESDRTILYGGLNSITNRQVYSDAWAYDHNTSQWTKLVQPNRPPAVAGHAMSYDIESDRIILFSSGPELSSDKTWAFDYNSNSWEDLNPAQPPPARVFGQNMAYDSESDRVILFGGSVQLVDGIMAVDDTWAYDYNTNTWTEMNPPISPPARQYYAMAYDSESDRIILFGGGDYTMDSAPEYTILYEDTWAYDFNSDTWTELMPETNPTARVYTDMVYNERSDRIILFGGGTGSLQEMDMNVLGHGNETWMYDYNENTWTEVTTDQAPSYRRKHKMAYDVESDCLILFGGDVWTVQGGYRYFQNETWTSEDWAGYSIFNDAMDVDTGDFMGWINTYQGDYIWSYALNHYMYCPEGNVGENGAWVWVYGP